MSVLEPKDMSQPNTLRNYQRLARSAPMALLDEDSRTWLSFPLLYMLLFSNAKMIWTWIFWICQPYILFLVFRASHSPEEC